MKIHIVLTAMFLSFQLSSCLSAQGRPRKCIMVFGAHADDVEGIAGGTLAKYISEGYEGIYVSVINNTAGCRINRAPSYSIFTESNSPHIYPADALETIQIRTEEAIQAAKVFGAIPVFLNFRETWVWQGRKRAYIGSDEFHQYSPPGRQLISVATRLQQDIDVVVELLEKYKPEITIIHTLGGEKHDHGNSGYMMYLAFKKAINKGVPMGKLWMPVNGWLSEQEAQESGRGKPDVRIDGTNFLKVKYEALSKHVSQKGIDHHKDIVPGEDYNERIENGRVYEEFITVIE